MQIIEYSEKCILVKGEDTKDIKEQLKEKGYKRNRYLGGRIIQKTKFNKGDLKIDIEYKPIIEGKIETKINKFDKIIESCNKEIEKLENSSLRSANPTRKRLGQIDSQNNQILWLNKIIGACEKLKERDFGINSRSEIEAIIRNKKMPGAYIHDHLIRNLKKDLDGRRGSKEILSEFRKVKEGQLNKTQIELLDKACKIIGENWSTKSYKEITKAYKIIDKLFDSEEEFQECKNYISVEIDNSKYELEKKIKEQLTKKIPGYFPTPMALVRQMIDLAEIKDGDIILEPSAGTGNIIDGIMEENKSVQIFGVEYNFSNYCILQEKYKDRMNIVLSNLDFLEYREIEVDKIIMNPPFENKQDMKHILYAWNLLKEGGKLIAIASNGLTFREDYQELRELINENGYYEKIEEGSFKESGTMVNTVLIVLSK